MFLVINYLGATVFTDEDPKTDGFDPTKHGYKEGKIEIRENVKLVNPKLFDDFDNGANGEPLCVGRIVDQQETYKLFRSEQERRNEEGVEPVNGTPYRFTRWSEYAAHIPK